MLYFQRDGETYHVVSETGTVQGDAAFGIFFNAGLQRAFNKLRAEYPEALLAKYADDVNGAVVGTHADDGIALLVNVNEQRAFIGTNTDYPPLCPISPLTLCLILFQCHLLLSNAGSIYALQCAD